MGRLYRSSEITDEVKRLAEKAVEQIVGEASTFAAAYDALDYAQELLLTTVKPVKAELPRQGES